MGTGKGGLRVWEDRREEMDAGLTRYPPYPNGATARWPYLAEGPRCGRGRGAGWSSSPLLRFQPWQSAWGVRVAGANEDTDLGGPEVLSPGCRRPFLTEGHQRPTAGCLRRKQGKGSMRPPAPHQTSSWSLSGVIHRGGPTAREQQSQMSGSWLWPPPPPPLPP